MKLASGLATVEDFETGEYHEQYRIVYEATTKSKHLEILKWFVKSKYRKVLVLPDKPYKNPNSLRSALSDRMGFIVQPEDCFVSVTQKRDRVYLEKT